MGFENESGILFISQKPNYPHVYSTDPPCRAKPGKLHFLVIGKWLLFAGKTASFVRCDAVMNVPSVVKRSSSWSFELIMGRWLKKVCASYFYEPHYRDLENFVMVYFSFDIHIPFSPISVTLTTSTNTTEVYIITLLLFVCQRANNTPIGDDRIAGGIHYPANQIPYQTSDCIINSWASCQISKIERCTCAGNAGNVFPATTGKRSRRTCRHRTPKQVYIITLLLFVYRCTTLPINSHISTSDCMTRGPLLRYVQERRLKSRNTLGGLEISIRRK